jgi:AcrR family transcriptional regulator
MRQKKSRPYRKDKRAQQEEETRRRITEAVVELHRTVGPANTTVTDVADRAGVSRMTVYNHFPTESDLIEACSTHWVAHNPFPDPTAWQAIDDPFLRLQTALGELYRFYRRTQDMLGKVLRDAPLISPLGEIMEERWWPYLGLIVQVLRQGWSDDPAMEEIDALLSLAVDFHTWKVLTTSGLTDARAIECAASMVSAAVSRRSRQAGAGSNPAVPTHVTKGDQGIEAGSRSVATSSGRPDSVSETPLGS